MIENHLVDKIHCFDQNTDTLELIESICFNTIVLDLKVKNDFYVTTYIIIDRKTAHKLSESLKNGPKGKTMKAFREKIVSRKINWLAFDDSNSTTVLDN